MVLPGVQTLFGFQLIAVFQAAFAEDLSHAEQRLHLLSLAMVALAGALVMTPAAYHRQTSPHAVSTRLVRLGGRFLLGSMVTLTIGIGLDFYLIAHLILNHEAVAVLVSIVLVALFVGCWFVLPRHVRRRAASRGSSFPGNRA
jgi:Flp pilus assembly protein TadB